MSKQPDQDDDPPVRKSVTMPKSFWAAISDYHHTHRLRSEAEALRRLVDFALKNDKSP